MEIIKKDNKLKNEIMKKEKLKNEMIEKEELKRLYVDEGKSMIKISKICGCHVITVKNILKKYEIPIRPNGAFLIDNDGVTLYSKYIKEEIRACEYNNESAKKRGFKNCIEYENERVKKRGFKDSSDYHDNLAKKRGFKNSSDYQNYMNHKTGRCLPMSENKECSKYLGIHIAERILSLIFENVKRMPEDNPRYDFICNNGYKIDVKSACLHTGNKWTYIINKNKIADYFLIIAFDNRENLNIIHIWLVKGDAYIEKTTTYLSEDFIINEKNTITIGKGNKALKRWEKYEITDKLDDIQKICDEFKENKTY